MDGVFLLGNEMKCRRIGRCLIGLVGLVFGMASYGAEGVDGFPTPDSIEYKNLIVESVYNYQINKYTKPILMDVSSEKKSAYLTPIDTLKAHFSAMRNLDYKWFMSTWDDSSVVLMESKNKALGRDGQYWVNLWNELKLNSSLQLNGWMQYGQYVLVDYTVYSDSRKDGVMSDVVALKKINGGWRLTQDLAANPLLSKGNLQAGRIRRLGE